MHFEVLAEDLSLAMSLEHIMPKILRPLNTGHTYKIINFSGKGSLPKRGKSAKVSTNKLLNELPRRLRAYGKSLQNFPAAIIVVLDLDNDDCFALKQDLLKILNDCSPRPTALFRIAIEESEAWLLGDRRAVKSAYPQAKDRPLDRYKQDSICGTWQKLADAIYPGGSAAVPAYPQRGQVKCEWAGNIAPHLDVDRNASKSFQVFRDGVRRLAEAS